MPASDESLALETASESDAPTVDGDPAAGQARPDAFISYRRLPADTVFVDQLQAALAERGKQIWVDRTAIEPAADWWDRITRGIEAAKAFIFVISPESVASEVCQRELETAAQYHKLVVPVVLSDVGSRDLPESLTSLAKLNWIFFTSGHDAERALDEIVVALEEDLDWRDRHTRLAVRTQEWTKEHRDRSFLLRGSDLRQAQEWLGQAAVHEKTPPTPLQTEYILASQKAAARTQRTWVSALAVGLVVAIGLTVFAFVQRNQARAETRLATTRLLLSEASQLEASRPGLARQLLVEANHVDPTPQVLSALFSSSSIPNELDFRGSVRAEAYSPRAPVLAVGTDNGISLVNTVTGQKLATMPSHTGYISALAFSPDARLLATGGADGAVRIWDATNPNHPRLINIINPSLGIIGALRFSANGHVLASAYDNQAIRLWNIANPGHPVTLTTIPGYATAGLVTSLALSNNGLLAAPGPGNTVRIWNIDRPARPRRLATLHISTGGATALAFSTDGQILAAGGSDNYVHLWDVTNPTRPRTLPVLTGDTSTVDALAFSPHGKVLASGSWDGSARLWDVTDPTHPTVMATLPGHSDFVSAVAFSPNGQMLAGGSYDDSVFLWNITSPGNSVPLASLAGSDSPIAFSPSRPLVAAGSPATLWNVSAPSDPLVVTRLIPTNTTAAGATVQELSFDPTGRLLAAVELDGTTLLWDVSHPAQPRLAATLPGHGIYNFLSFSQDGKILLTPGGAWNVANPTHPARASIRTAPSSAQLRAKLSYAGMTMPATALMEYWAVQSPGNVGQLRNWLTYHPKANVLAVAPQKGSVLTARPSSQQAEIWQVSHPLAPASILTGPGSAFQTASFSPSGNTLAVSSSSSTNIWNVANPAQAANISQLTLGQYGLVSSVFSPDGHYLITGATGVSAQLWDLSINSMVERLCVETGSPITLAQWHQYAPGIPYSRPCTANAILRGPSDLVNLPSAGSATQTSGRAPSSKHITIETGTPNLRHANWANMTIPVKFCAVPGLVKLKQSQATAVSGKWGKIQIFEDSHILYGRLQGYSGEDAAISVWCDNGGGTADGQLAQAYLIFNQRGTRLTLIGTISAREQPSGVHISYITGISFKQKSIIAHEVWYRPSDATCCPSGTALTRWTLAHGQLVPGRPDITS